MTIQHLSRLAAALALAISAAACVAEGKTDPKAAAAPAATDADGDTPQPRSAVYRCDDSSSLSVENFSTTVRVTAQDGEAIDLPAAPPGQRSRYGQTIYALVLDGSEALYVKGNQAPLTCRR